MKTLIFTFAILSLAAFGQHHSQEHAHHAQAARKKLSAEEQASVIEVLKKNDQLFNALLRKDGALIEKISQELSVLVSRSTTPTLKNVKAQVSSLKGIKASAKIDENLKAYELFLNPLIKVVQEYDVGSKFNVFSCPMVKKSWVQDVTVNKDVKNVYAMDMLECGTQDTHF